MSMNQPARTCRDCEADHQHPSRRAFLRTTVGGLAAASALPLVAGPMISAVRAEPLIPAAKVSASETLVATFFKTLSDAQKKEVCFPFDHALRSKVDNNWNIVAKTVGDFYTPDQQALIRDIFRGLHSEEYVETVMKQVEHDNKSDGGFKGCSVAMFGEPGAEKKFEFVLTGRHVTRRCDGNSVEGAAFGGPIFYGHAFESFNEKKDHPGNVYWYQAKRANEVFAALSGKQRELALFTDAREEKATDTVKLREKKDEIPGIPMPELSKDQQELVRKVMADLLAPFRKADADEAMKLIEAAGFENLRLAFARNHDIGDDGVWDVWQIEGPNMLWYFRGAPHVHTWVHVREVAKRA